MYNLNINKSSIVPTNLIVGRVLDKPFDTIQFKIYDGLDVMDLTGCTMEFRGITPDNKKVTSNAVKILDAKSGEIEFTFPPNFYSAKGHFQNAYFVIKKGTNSESTNDLLITVLNAVDFNLDDAPIIIDQMDDLIQAVIDDLNNQLSKVKGDIKQTQDNITALKKDVDAYKGQFNTEIAKMQKRLDDLAKAINQTDIQRPQITTTEGKELVSVISGQDLFEEINKSELGLKTIKVNGGVTNSPDSNLSFVGQYHLMFKNKANKMSDITIVLYSSTGEVYHYTMRAGYSTGWKRLDGQVQKITQDNGDIYLYIDDVTKTLTEIITDYYKSNKLSIGLFKIQIYRTSDWNKGHIYGMLNVIMENDGKVAYSFMGSGNVGSYSIIQLLSGGTTFKQLDNVDIPNVTTSKSGLMSSTDKVKLDGLQNYSNATTTNSGLMSSTDKVKLNSLEKYEIATQSKDGLMSSTDKVKLDNKPLKSIQTLNTSDINYNTNVILNDDIDNYEYIDVVIRFEGNTTSSRNIVTGNAMTVSMGGVNLYNADSSTGWNMGELTLDITSGNRAKVLRTKVVDNGGTVENNVDKIRVISIQGINKLK